METLDLGLSTEEDALNNKSTRDPVNFHQHSLEEKLQREAAASALHHHKPRQPNPVTKKEHEVTIVNDDEDVETTTVANEEAEDDGANSEEEDKSAQPQKKRKVNAESAQPLDENHARVRNGPTPQVNGCNSNTVARPVLSMKGHTAFLTFAIRSLTD
jgi:hypothetical protein